MECGVLVQSCREDDSNSLLFINLRVGYLCSESSELRGTFPSDSVYPCVPDAASGTATGLAPDYPPLLTAGHSLRQAGLSAKVVVGFTTGSASILPGPGSTNPGLREQARLDTV